MEEISRAASAIAQSRQPRFPGTGNHHVPARQRIAAQRSSPRKSLRTILRTHASGRDAENHHGVHDLKMDIVKSQKLSISQSLPFACARAQDWR
jgi:hypothetical protein